MNLSGTKQPRRTIGLLSLSLLLAPAHDAAATPAIAGNCSATSSEVAASYDYALGAQAFGADHQTGNSVGLVDQAQEIKALGSNVLKFSLGKRQAKKYGFMEAASTAKTELDYIKSSRGLQKVLDMDFSYYLMWVQSFTPSDWHDGVSEKEAKAYYDEMYDLTVWLLKRYSGTGKTFLLGNWEGDWMLNGREDKDATPSPQAIDGMTKWLNIRQQAIDDAKAATKHDGVGIYQYVEVNLVKRGMEGKPSVASSVIPNTNVDLVSYSSYEAIKQSPTPDIESVRQPLTTIVRYLNGQLKPKPGLPFAQRVFIGEYGYHANSDDPPSVKRQYLKSRDVMQVALELDLPFALIWQLYNNEFTPNGRSNEMSLINEAGHKRALYFLHQRFLGTMHDYVAESCLKTGHAPTRDAFRAKALGVLSALSFEDMQKAAGN